MLKRALLIAFLSLITTPTKSAPKRASLKHLLKTFDRQPPRYVLQQLALRNNDELLLLSIYSTIGSAVFLRACQANPNITFVIGGTRTNCGMVANQFAQTIQWIGVRGAQQNVVTQRDQLLVVIECGNGRDKRSCGAYANTMRNLNQMSHNTSLRIISNMPTGTCIVGRDPNCHP